MLAQAWIIILEIINLIEFTINFDKRMTKKFNKYIEKNDSLNHYDFYDDYLIISNEMLAKKFFYKDIVKFIETESNFYLEVRDNKGFIYIKKENASENSVGYHEPDRLPVYAVSTALYHQRSIYAVR